MLEASRQRRERPARRHPVSLQVLVTLAYTFSAPKVVLGLLIPCRVRPQIPTPPLPHVEQTVSKAQEPSGMMTGRPGTSRGHPTAVIGTDRQPGRDGSAGETLPGPQAAAVLHCPELFRSWRSPKPRRKTLLWGRNRTRGGKHKGPTT